MKTAWLNVRCCCRPQKILGHLEISTKDVFHGNKISFVAYKTLSTSFKVSKPDIPYLPSCKRIDLEVSWVNGPNGYSEIALRPNEDSLEDLKNIRGFKAFEEI